MAISNGQKLKCGQEAWVEILKLSFLRDAVIPRSGLTEAFLEHRGVYPDCVPHGEWMVTSDTNTELHPAPQELLRNSNRENVILLFSFVLLFFS